MNQRNIVLTVVGIVALICLAGIFSQLRSALEPQEISELKLQNQTAKIQYKTTKLAQQHAVTSNPYVITSDMILAISLRLSPLIILFCAFAFLVLKPMPFECAGGVKAHVSRWNERAVLQSALLVSAMSEQAKAAAFGESVANARADTLVKFAHAIRVPRETLNISNTMPALPEHVEPVAPNTPNFQQAMADMKPGHILIGYDNNKPIHFCINQFVSGALAGGSGSGKTTKERFFVGQMAVNGIRTHILDAHAGSDESLVNSLGNISNLPNVTTYSPIDTRDTIRFFLNDLEEAKKHPELKETTIYVIDELLPIMDLVPETATFILKIATEGRKYERFGLFSGQVWPAALFGKAASSVRDALMLKMSARLPIEQGRILFKSKEKAQTVERLQLSEMYATSMQYSGVVSVPFASREDMNALAASETAKANTSQPSLPFVTNPFDTALQELKSRMSLEDIYRRSGLCNGMTLATFETKCKPSSRRAFTAIEEAAILNIQGRDIT